MNIHGEPAVLTITTAGDEEFTIIATSETPHQSLAILFDGLLAVSNGTRVPANGRDAATKAQSFRAEAPNLTDLIPSLIDSVFVDLLEEVPGLEGLQLDGLIRTDVGMAAWGYAFVAADSQQSRHLTVTALTVESTMHLTTLTVTVHRA